LTGRLSNAEIVAEFADEILRDRVLGLLRDINAVVIQIRKSNETTEIHVARLLVLGVHYFWVRVWVRT
jgi:hypothetical protein